MHKHRVVTVTDSSSFNVVVFTDRKLQNTNALVYGPGSVVAHTKNLSVVCHSETLAIALLDRNHVAVLYYWKLSYHQG